MFEIDYCVFKKCQLDVLKNWNNLWLLEPESILTDLDVDKQMLIFEVKPSYLNCHEGYILMNITIDSFLLLE